MSSKFNLTFVSFAIHVFQFQFQLQLSWPGLFSLVPGEGMARGKLWRIQLNWHKLYALCADQKVHVARGYCTGPGHTHKSTAFDSFKCKSNVKETIQQFKNINLSTSPKRESPPLESPCHIRYALTFQMWQSLYSTYTSAD